MNSISGAGGDMGNVPASAVRLLAAAPHRLLFLVGAGNVLAAMSWWTFWLAGMRWHWWNPGRPPLPAGWMHAVIMQYQVLPPFIFGFLLTVFPRWLSQAPLTPRAYLPVGAGLLGGQLLTLLGLPGHATLLQAGALLTFAGWAYGMWRLATVLLRADGRHWHAISCLAALGFGLAGLVFYMLLTLKTDARLAYAAIRLGGIPMLLTIYFTVCHRMIPFFTNIVVPDYKVVRPMWALGAAWPLVIAHTALELVHGYAWLWIPDTLLAALCAGLLIAWWPRARVPALLRVLHLAFAWLPVAFLLYATQSAWYALRGEFMLGRAPAHALFIGFFGSMLVAMVTRVTQGHSGRPLVLGPVAAAAFVTIQVVAVMRVVAELVPDALGWQAAAALGWIAAFLPWVVRSAWIYLTPRADGHPG